jgi:hypothetical protein
MGDLIASDRFSLRTAHNTVTIRVRGASLESWLVCGGLISAQIGGIALLITDSRSANGWATMGTFLVLLAFLATPLVFVDGLRLLQRTITFDSVHGALVLQYGPMRKRIALRDIERMELRVLRKYRVDYYLLVETSSRRLMVPLLPLGGISEDRSLTTIRAVDVAQAIERHAGMSVPVR